jgi:hypothetical protein
VQEELKTDPFSGIIYVFRAKRSDRVKLLFWDQTGLWRSSVGPRSPMASCACRRHSSPPYWKASTGRACTHAVSCGPQRRNDPHVRLIVE